MLLKPCSPCLPGIICEAVSEWCLTAGSFSHRLPQIPHSSPLPALRLPHGQQESKQHCRCWVRVLGAQDQLQGIIMPLIPLERVEVSPVAKGFRARAGEPLTLGLCTHRCSEAPALQNCQGVIPTRKTQGCPALLPHSVWK